MSKFYLTTHIKLFDKLNQFISIKYYEYKNYMCSFINNKRFSIGFGEFTKDFQKKFFR